MRVLIAARGWAGRMLVVATIGGAWLLWEATGDALILLSTRQTTAVAGDHGPIEARLAWAEGALPTDDRVLRAIARTHLVLATGSESEWRTRAAIEALHRARQAAPFDARLDYALAWLYLRSGELQAADLRFQSALAKDPVSAEHHYGLGRVRERQGRIPEAVGSYRTALDLDASPKIEARLQYLEEGLATGRP